ncbi:ABC transporter substrate-binding protein [Micromonospora sp. DT233]|uniref:ABC transporter substrate-binding protein n=1 Tax=Micromonospora sp. DT233 TaxID=3393432 RepID=UPI003CEF10EF
MPLSRTFHRPIDYDSRFVGEAVVRTLLTEADGPPVPRAARHAETLDDGRRLRVHLDTSLRWSDGEPLRAAHLVDTIGVRADSVERPVDFLPTGADAVDEGTVDIHFACPTVFAPALLTLPRLAPYRDGPVLGSHVPVHRAARSIRLARHPFAWDSPDRPDELIFRAFASFREALDAFEAGTLDVTPTLGFNQAGIDAFRDHPRLTSRDLALFGSLEFGRRAGALRESPATRRALSGLLDRDDLVASLSDLLSPWRQQVDPWSGAPLSDDPPGGRSTATVHELDELRSALTAAPELAYADFAPNGGVVEAVCRQVEAQLGVRLAPRPLSFPQYVRAAATGEHDLLYTLTTADFPDPAALLTPWRSSSPAARRAGLADQELDRLIGVAAGCLSVEQRHAAWRAANQRWLELMPRIPLVRARSHVLCSERVGALALSGSGFVDFDLLTTAPATVHATKE